MSLIIDIKVVPRSGKSLCILDKTGELKCYLKSEPERGKANEELIMMIARALKINRHDVRIVAGASSRRKRIQIETDRTKEQLCQQLGIEKQLPLF